MISASGQEEKKYDKLNWGKNTENHESKPANCKNGHKFEILSYNPG